MFKGILITHLEYFMCSDSNDPMESCRELKDEYEACFNFWFAEKFLKGDHNDSMCAGLLKSYTECVQVPTYLFPPTQKSFSIAE